jgi:hypothetical protein
VFIVNRFRVRDAVAVATAEHAKIVHVPGEVRQQVRDFDSGLSVPPEWTQRRKQLVLGHIAPRLERAEGLGDGLPCQTNQLRLGIEQIDVAWPAGHEKKEDAAGSWREVRRLRCEGIRWMRWVRRDGLGAKQPIAFQQRGQRQQAEASPSATQELPPAREWHHRLTRALAFARDVTPHKQKRSD